MNLTEDYKHAMRNLASSVSILTHRKNDEILGMTVSSATSYSAEPPIFMAAVHRESTIAGVLSLGDPLCMNMLNTDDQMLADHFTGRSGLHGAERFGKGNWDLDMDKAPRLVSALVSFSGRLRALIPQASHAILLVEIDEIIEGKGAPLVYHQRGYKSVSG